MKLNLIFNRIQFGIGTCKFVYIHRNNICLITNCKFYQFLYSISQILFQLYFTNWEYLSAYIILLHLNGIITVYNILTYY